MYIYPSLVELVEEATCHVHEYCSGPVYTTVAGVKTWVSDGYAATTREEVIRLALRNAEVRRGVVSLAGRMRI
jgi:hypothetical protein